MSEVERARAAPSAADEPRDGLSAAQAEDLPPADETTEMQRLQQELDAAVRERQELYERHLRLAAEFDNFRKRNEREWQDQRRRSASEVLRAVLEIADNLERALQSGVDEGQGLRAGVELIGQQLQALLQRFGLERIEAKGLPFDPTRHEAVLVVDAEACESQHVVDVVQNGYTLHGEILRPARVTVSR